MSLTVRLSRRKKTIQTRIFQTNKSDRRINFLLTGNKEVNFFEFGQTHTVVCYALVEAGLPPGDGVQGEDGALGYCDKPGTVRK